MDKEELQKLTDNLNKELIEIDRALSDIASENPLVKGDFEVKVQDMGPTQEDAAQEAGELDRNQAQVDLLERRRKEINSTLNKIKAGTYGKCETCSSDIGLPRLKAVPVASLCISCARKL